MTRPHQAAALVSFLVAITAGSILSSRDARSAEPKPAASAESKPEHHSKNVRFDDIQWERMVPELGDRSSEIAILRVDPKTQATHLMIRVPANTHVPKHWHTANETHTVMQGTFIMECEGKRETLGAGSWNYIPSKMHHEAWTMPDE